MIMDEDAVLLAIGGLKEAMKQTDCRIDRMEKSLMREIGSIKGGIQSCQGNCRESREKVGSRLRVIEDFRTQILAYTVAASLIISLVGNWVVSKLFGGS